MSLIFTPLELVLNRGIAGSATARALAASLEGKTLELRLPALPTALRLAVATGRVRVGTGSDAPADVVLEGGPLSVLRLLGEEDPQLLREAGVRLTGSTETATRFRELLRFAAPDLEEELSRLLGDPLAHRLGEGARQLGAFGRRTRRSFERSLGEYLREERGSLPARGEVDGFLRDVDALVNDVERAAARIERLRRPRDT